MYDELFTRPTCVNCRQEVSGLGIECAECHGGNFRLCCECFAVGAEIGQHKKEHRYRFFDSGSLALFPASAVEIASAKENNGSSSNPRWSAREEIRLLDAIEQYGFGNWQDISKHIESRSAADAKKEFVDRFVAGNIGQLSWADRNNNADEENDFGLQKDIGSFPQPIDHTLPSDDGPLSPSLTSRLPPLDISQDEMLQLGYMPFRDDYEKEFDNDAEKLVSQLNFTPDDDEVDIGCKLALVDMYSRRLRERARRKRVIRDYQLVCKFFKKDRTKAGTSGADISTKDTNKKFQGQEKQLYEKLTKFAQFYNCQEFENLIKNLVQEKELRFRLQELYKYRMAGLTSADECMEYERSKANSSRNKKGGLSTGDEDDGDEDRSYKKPATPTQAQIPHPQTNSEPDLEKIQIVPQTNERSDGSSDASVNLNPTQLPCSNGDSNSRNLESNELAAASSLQLEKGANQLSLQDLLEENSFPLKERPKASVDRYTANFVPGIDLLSYDEINLCQKIHLHPSQYLTIKLAYILKKMRLSSGNENQDDENLLSCPAEFEENEWLQIIQFLASKDSIKNESNHDQQNKHNNVIVS